MSPVVSMSSSSMRLGNSSCRGTVRRHAALHNHKAKLCSARPQVVGLQTACPTNRALRMHTNRSSPAPARAFGHSAVHAAAVSVESELLRSTRHDIASERAGCLQLDVRKVPDGYEVDVRAEPPRNMVLHWAVNEWSLPSRDIWPPNTNQAGDKAVQTRFSDRGLIQLRFANASCPQKIVFVLKELDPETWVNDGGADFTVHLKPPGLDSVMNKVLTAEATYTNWSLFNRFCLAIEMLDAADVAGPAGMGFYFTWLRLSSMRQLAWYRNSNYQSKDIAHIQKTLSQRVADKARTSKDPWCRLFARMSLEGLPRGGGNGDDIRMGILHIMRSNNIKEGHRPGLDEPFLEQWHQKLHTNTTPDDVAICEAYLAFLHSGNHDDYWRVLWDVGRLSKQDLESFDKPIKAWPKHLPWLIDSFKHYRWLLKVTHSGADLDTAMEMSKGLLDDDLRYQLYDLLNNRHEWWVPGKTVELRRRLAYYWKGQDASRDLLLLDIALDSWFRTRIESTNKSQLQGDDLMNLMSLVLQNALLTADDVELQQALALWEWAKGSGSESHGPRWGQAWAVSVLAALQRVELTLAAYMDTLYSLVQPPAEAFQRECKLDPKYIMNFGEEVVRGRSLFVLSPLLQFLEPMIRNAAGMAPWQVISNGSGTTTGSPLVVGSLADIQGKVFSQPTIVMAGAVGGNEDIPTGVTAVLTRSSVDVLSHAAIRARAQRVLMATCYDAQQWADMTALMQGVTSGAVTVAVTTEGDVRAVVAPAAAAVPALPHDGQTKDESAVPPRSALPTITLQPPTATEKWVLNEAEFAPGLVGAKSLNCMALAAARGTRLPDDINVPASLTLPLGTFERVLASAENTEVAAEIAETQMRAQAAAAVQEAAGADYTPVLQTLKVLRDLVLTRVTAPPAFRSELAAAAASCGLIPSADTWTLDTPAWNRAWAAIRQVWASKWNDRAWLSRRALRVPDADLFMAVLLQQVVPADYAFVLHTADPVTGTAGSLVGEVVPGMGEALVGNYPGRALTFSCRLSDAETGGTAAPSIMSLPSKRTVLRCVGDGGSLPVLIARSDANGEDLQDLAGAGLYDSVPFFPLEETTLDAVTEPLITDATFTRRLLARLVDVGRSVRQAFNGVEQDVEGVISGDHIWVVQSRPQVIHSSTPPAA